MDEAVRHALETGDQSRISGYAYKTYTYVYKDYAKASTGLDLGSDAPPQPEYDFLETDYR